MANDLKNIQILSKLLGKEHLIQTDLSAIIPMGLSGYSLDENNLVTGIKIGGPPSEDKIISDILDIIPNFKKLKRFVFYTSHPFELTKEICLLPDLKYIDIDGVVKFPVEIFSNNRKLSYPYHSSIKKRRSKSEVVVGKRIELFKKYNPELKFAINALDLISRRQADIGINLLDELELFCILTKKTKDELTKMSGINIEIIGNIEDPPYEIIDQGENAIVQYFNEKDKQGTERLYEAKIVIVGAGESGKTTLIKKLNNPNHPVPNDSDKRTEGIRVTTYQFKGVTRHGQKHIQAYIWDFGGQELYHTTHQLFLTPDTLYILLNDNRKNDTDFYYWLNIVTLRAGNKCPILMVFNAKDNAVRQIIPGEEIYSTFPNLIKNSIDVNFADKDIRLVQKMRLTIENHFLDLDILGKPFPAFWVKVRDALVKRTEEHIDWETYSEICKKNGINDYSQKQVLANTLHNLGVILYFPKVFGLENLIILKSQWCIDAIYSALDTKEIVQNGGRFNESMLAEKWSDQRFLGNHLQLLKLMQHFDLCYKIDGTEDYIAPQLLPVEENKLSKNANSWAITFHFNYAFMPSGLITRLIARMSLYIKQNHVWRSGVILDWGDGTYAEIIEHQLTHKIVIRINGSDKKRRLLDIRKCLYDLQEDFIGLKFKEKIACNCQDCKKGGLITMYELATLKDDAEYNDFVTCRNGTRKKIPAKNILDGISYEDKPRIFISYSHKNEDCKDEFRTMISPMVKEGHWKVWDDRWLLPGDNWNKEILKHLNEANVIVLMLTANFFESDFIYNIELTRAIERHEKGEALIIGVIVSDCMWEETPLNKILMLPKDGTPIERHKNRSEVWKTVASKIKETIAIRKDADTRLGGWNDD